MSLTLISLISGVVLMAISNEFYIKHRNKIMIIRVLLQFISLILIALFFR
ncbi:putative membrane protein [Ehrlichia chaffeensis str. Jax]|nr:putative membrane protein [Ehrlichia chaffeensis str. Jax]AHX09303.1 putative membrane protein [Ehrlichia chaffeensis str. Wakulla]